PPRDRPARGRPRAPPRARVDGARRGHVRGDPLVALPPADPRRPPHGRRLGGGPLAGAGQERAARALGRRADRRWAAGVRRGDASVPRVTRTWPADWQARKAGKGCPMCAEGRPERVGQNERIFTGETLDAYLVREDV